MLDQIWSVQTTRFQNKTQRLAAFLSTLSIKKYHATHENVYRVYNTLTWNGYQMEAMQIWSTGYVRVDYIEL